MNNEGLVLLAAWAQLAAMVALLAWTMAKKRDRQA